MAHTPDADLNDDTPLFHQLLRDRYGHHPAHTLPIFEAALDAVHPVGDDPASDPEPASTPADD